MSKGRFPIRRGFTLTELTVTSVIAVIIILAVGIALAGTMRGWQTTYDRVHSSVTRDSYAAKRAFDAVIRKSCRQNFLLGEGGEWLEVYYYASYSSPFADRYARFFVDNGVLKLEEGIRDTAGNKQSVISTVTVCSDVHSCVFKSYGRSIQMMLSLDSGTQRATVVSSAVLHNP